MKVQYLLSNNFLATTESSIRPHIQQLLYLKLLITIFKF